jgi:hypothetical protein
MNTIQPDLNDEFDWQWVVILPAAVLSFVLVQHAVFLLTAIPGLPILAAHAVWALSDWAATVAAVYVAMRLAPRHHSIVAMISAVLLTCWHTIILCTGHDHPISGTCSMETITITAIGGIILTATACTIALIKVQGDAAKRAALIRSLEQISTTDEHPIEIEYKVSPSQSSSQSDMLDYALPNLSAGAATAEKAVEPKKETVRAWFDSDMRLLELELRVLNLEPDAYISAIRLALAIERAGGMNNCSGDKLCFNQICLDCCMRFSLVVSEKPERWRRFANSFRRYGELPSDERAKLLITIEGALPVPASMAQAS